MMPHGVSSRTGAIVRLKLIMPAYVESRSLTHGDVRHATFRAQHVKGQTAVAIESAVMWPAQPLRGHGLHSGRPGAGARLPRVALLHRHSRVRHNPMLNRIIHQQIHHHRPAYRIAARLTTRIAAGVLRVCPYMRGQAQQQTGRGVGEVEGYAHGIKSLFRIGCVQN